MRGLVHNNSRVLTELLDDEGVEFRDIQGPFQAAGVLAGGLAGLAGGVVVGGACGTLAGTAITSLTSGGLVGGFIGGTAIGRVGTAFDDAGLVILQHVLGPPMRLVGAAVSRACASTIRGRPGPTPEEHSSSPCAPSDSAPPGRVAFIEDGSLVFMDGATRVAVRTDATVRTLKQEHGLAAVFLLGGEDALEDMFVLKPGFEIDSDDEDLYEMSRAAVPAPDTDLENSNIRESLSLSTAALAAEGKEVFASVLAERKEGEGG
jgi:hypothetical protein